MFKVKKFVASVLTCVMLASNSVFVSASTSSSRDFYFNGVRYVITESIDANGNKKVDVVGGGERSSVINDGESLKLTTQAKDGTSKYLDISMDSKLSENKFLGSYAEKSTPYWGYSYAYNPDARSELGIFWMLRSGDDNGSWHGYDGDNSTAQDYAYEFCSNVRSLDNCQWSALAASGSCGGTIATSIAAFLGTLGVAGVISIVSAILSGGVALAEWIAAYNAAQDCNQSFVRFKQAVDR